MSKRKERGRQLLRVLKLIKLFEHSRYGLTINELCREMTVTRRTLYRDLEMVEDAGYRFVKEGGGGGFSKKWRFPTGMRINALAGRSLADRRPGTRVGQRCQQRLDLSTQVLEGGREDERLPEMLGILVE